MTFNDDVRNLNEQCVFTMNRCEYNDINIEK